MEPFRQDGSSKLLEGHSRAVAQMRLSPDGSKLLSASDDSTVRCWHLQEPMVNDSV